MAIKLVDRSDPSGTLTDPADPTKEQVLNSTLLVQLSDETTEAEATIRQIIENAVNDAVIRALQNVTRDLRYNATETWATAGDSAGLHATGASFGNTELQAVTDWAASYTIPSAITESTGSIVIRLPEGANPHDYRILLEDGSYRNFDASLLVGFGTLSGFDVYLAVISFIGDYAKGNMLVLQHHGVDAHTDYFGGVPAIEADITVLQADVANKQELRAFDAFLDRNYYVRPNREPITYYLQLHNIVSVLLPGVDNIRATMRGQVVHAAAFNPAADTEQVVSIELNATEIGNIVNNIGSDTTLNLDIEFRDSSTVVERHRIELPIVNAPPRREVQDVLDWDLSRANTVTATLPTTYTAWRFCKILTRQGDGGGNLDPILIETSDLARGNIPLLGRGNNQVVWNSSTRVITPEPASRNQQAPVLVKVSLIS